MLWRSFMPALALLLTGAPALAEEHVVQMKNKGSNNRAMAFEPDYVKAAVGDTVKFVAADKGHIVETLPGVWPAGVTPLKGKFNEDASVTLSAEGLYGIKCQPHQGAGMVALVVVGKPAVTDQVRSVKQPPLAQKAFAELLDRAAKEQ